MLSKNVETLENMNGTTAKFAKWYVRIIDPKVMDRAETVHIVLGGVPSGIWLRLERDLDFVKSGIGFCNRRTCPELQIAVSCRFKSRCILNF